MEAVTHHHHGEHLRWPVSPGTAVCSVRFVRPDTPRFMNTKMVDKEASFFKESLKSRDLPLQLGEHTPDRAGLGQTVQLTGQPSFSQICSSGLVFQTISASLTEKVFPCFSPEISGVKYLHWPSRKNSGSAEEWLFTA
ncbi:hypothetical protein MUG91_G81n294 [Manis pentadactyla]|nr:hypothetical protein MUG91_G81n294 [Manis pentadactyla]